MRTKIESDLLRRIEELPEPRHLFVLPDWADAATLDRLIDEGYVSATYCQHNDKGLLVVAMGLELTTKGKFLAQPKTPWRRLVFKGSLAGAGLAALSLVILYVG